MEPSNLLTQIEITDNIPREISTIFYKLRELTAEYCSKYKDDAPYWYNERANVSFLAGAIWRCGGMALEEFRSPKPSAEGNYTGRTDLWFSFNGKSYISEAKLLWVDLPSDQDQIALNTKSSLDDATNDIKGSQEACDYKLAIVFVVPKINNGNKDKPNLLGNLVKLLKTRSQQDILAPIFPKNFPVEKTLEYPGVIVLIKKVG